MNRILRLILALMILAFFVTGTLAQSVTTGSISGIVTDQSGAAVPGITVTATSPNLIQPQSAATGADGRYSIFNLPPGKYTVTAEAQKGFAKTQQGNIDVNLGRTATGDLACGSVLSLAKTRSVEPSGPGSIQKCSLGTVSANAPQYRTFVKPRLTTGALCFMASLGALLASIKGSARQS